MIRKIIILTIKVKFIYSEKVTKFCEISTLLLTGTTQDKSKVEILHNFVAFSEYMIFTRKHRSWYTPFKGNLDQHIFHGIKGRQGPSDSPASNASAHYSPIDCSRSGAYQRLVQLLAYGPRPVPPGTRYHTPFPHSRSFHYIAAVMNFTGQARLTWPNGQKLIGVFARGMGSFFRSDLKAKLNKYLNVVQAVQAVRILTILTDWLFSKKVPNDLVFAYFFKNLI